jgi:sugar lactone lactonase YvrE
MIFLGFNLRKAVQEEDDDGDPDLPSFRERRQAVHPVPPSTNFFESAMKLPLISRLSTCFRGRNTRVLWISVLGLVLSCPLLLEMQRGTDAGNAEGSTKAAATAAGLTSGSAMALPQAGARKPLNEQASEAMGQAGEKESLMAAFAQALLQIQTPDANEARLPENAGVKYFISNPRQELSARFTDHGAVLGSERTGGWQARVAVGAVGTEKAVSAVPAKVEPGVEGGRVSYERGMLVEWYENKPTGIEHGVTVLGRPASLANEDAARLRVDLRMSGLSATRDGDSMVLVDAKNQRVMRYDGLKVWDAKGRQLAAEMSPIQGGVSILVADAGAAYPVMIDPLFTSLETKLSRAELECGKPGDYYGHAVDIIGDLAMVGCPGDDNLRGTDAGGAYLFMRSGNAWSLVTKLKAGDGRPGDRLGGSVAIGGGFVLVGCRMADLPGKVDAGAVYMFALKSGFWTQTAKLTARDASAGAWFGESLAIDGSNVIIGSPTVSDGRGAAYHFTRSGTTCTQKAVLKASDAQPGDGFGGAVAVSGGRAFIGAPFRNAARGAVYSFELAGSTWLQVQTLTHSAGSSGDLFGDSVLLDFPRAIVGAPGRDSAAGAAYVFGRSGSNWVQGQELKASDAAAGDAFGMSMSLHRTTILIGAPGDDLTNPDQGSAYLFSSEGASTWSQQAKLKDDAGLQGDWFGGAVAFDQTTAVIGAFQADAPGWNNVTIEDLGVVYVFRVFASSGPRVAVRLIDPSTKLPPLGELVDGDSIYFGEVLVGRSSSNSFLIENLGASPLNNLKGLISGTHGAMFALSSPLPASLPPGGSLLVTVLFKPKSEGGKLASLKITSNDPARSSLSFVLSGIGVMPDVPDPGAEAPQFVVVPESQMVSIGQNVRLVSRATGVPTPTYQWKKGTGVLAGKKGGTLGFKAQLSSAGTYSVRAVNIHGDDDAPQVSLYVVGTQEKRLDVAEGLSATMKVEAAGAGLTYSWFFVRYNEPVVGNGTPIKAGDRYAISADGKTLTVSNLVSLDSGTYSCLVSGGGFSLFGGIHQLSVITGAPQFSEFSLPSGRITNPYNFQVPVNSSPSLRPATFSATGLPPGLTIDPLTGVISGTPTGAGNASYMVTITATNAKGSTPVTKQLYIEGINCSYVGRFIGLIERDGAINGGFGGYVEVNILPTATYSGFLSIAGVKLPFAGDFVYEGYTAGIAVTCTVERAKPYKNLKFSFEINPSSDGLVGTLLEASPSAPWDFGSFAGSPTFSGSLDGYGNLARFNGPRGLAKDRLGFIYVADTLNHVIRRISPGGEVITFAGVAGQSGLANGCGAEVRFNLPRGLVVDQNGVIYVADSGNRVIRAVSSEGKVTTLAGSGASGTADGTGASATFMSPSGITLASDGSLYVTDSGAHNIRRVTPAGVVTTLAGKAGVAGAVNGSGTSAQFNSPSGITSFNDKKLGEYLVVADSSNHCLRKVVIKTRAVTVLAGALGVSGDSDGLPANTRFNTPRGVAVDAKGNFYVTDSGNGSIRQLSALGIVTTLNRQCDTSNDHLSSYGRIGGRSKDNDCCGIEDPSSFMELDGIVWIGGYLFVSDSQLHNISFGQPVTPCQIDVRARRNPWGNDSYQPVSTRKATSYECFQPPASYYAGTYNFATNPCYEFTGMTSLVPQGSAVGTLTVRPDGTVTWVMTLADGTAVTGSSILGATYDNYYYNEIPIYSMLYTNTGSTQGWLTVSTDYFMQPTGAAGTQAQVKASPYMMNYVDGCLGWMKIAPASSSVRNYRYGIRRHGVTVMGEMIPSSHPGSGVVDQFFPGTSDNALLEFNEGGLNPSFSQVFTLNSDFTVGMPDNSRTLTFKFNAANLRFDGTFKLSDSNPVSGASPDTVKRNVSYNGVFLRRTGRGHGFFLLEQLPSAGPPATTPTTSPIFSGRVILSGDDFNQN